MQVKRLRTSCDSQLMVNQVNGSFAANDKSMATYLKQVIKFLPTFEKFKLTVVPMEQFLRPLISKEQQVMWIEDTPLWMGPIIAFLQDQLLAFDKEKAQRLRRRATHYTFKMAYSTSFSMSLFRCIGEEEATYVLREIHEGVYGNHSGGWALVQKVLRQGYY